MGVYINENTKVHMTTVHTRSKTKRSFSLVVKGMLISSALIASISLGGVQALASTNPSIPPTAITHQIDAIHEDEQALIANLNMAVKVLKESGWSVKTVNAILGHLEAIEDKLFDNNGLRSTEGVKNAILETERVVTAYGGDGLIALRGRNNTILETVGRIKGKLGMSTKLNNAPQSPVRPKGEVTIASATQTAVTVIIDGQPQTFPQPAIILNGSTMVPLRAIFEKLGAEIDWNGDTQTVTAKKDNTTIILTINSDLAFINGNPVKLTAKAQIVNSNTMVPLRFVSEALGGTVEWDGSTRTAYIESAKKPIKQVVNGITVKYGKHHYGVSSQKEYDLSLAIVEDALKGFDDLVFGGEYNEPYELYLIGERWSGDRQDRSSRNIGLKLAEGDIGELVEAGISKEEIIRVSKASTIAINLFKDKTDPLDGTPRSIYDALVLNLADCDPIAETYSAVYDSLGFNTMIIGGNNHADALIQIGGNWWKTGSGSFRQVDVAKALANGSYVFSQPTDGTIIR